MMSMGRIWRRRKSSASFYSISYQRFETALCGGSGENVGDRHNQDGDAIGCNGGGYGPSSQ